MMELRELTAVVNERFARYVEMLSDETPEHRVQFSRRITGSWALIYYQRHLVRLSPYLFLLEPHELRHGSHWRELDATLRHEAAHAVHFARTGRTGHDAGFHALLAKLGVEANGGCDLGPENMAFRYVYACPGCGLLHHRRLPMRGNWSCGTCAPGRYAPEFRMTLMVDLGSPYTRLRRLRTELINEAVAEARASTIETPLPLSRSASKAVSSS